MNDGRRVAVTGIGIVSPVGNDRASAWGAVCDGRSGIGRIETFDLARYDVHIAGGVRDFDPLEYVTKRELRRLDRFVQFAYAAGDRAIAQSGIKESGLDPTRIGVYVGTGIGGLHTIEEGHLRLVTSGPDRVSPLMIPKLMTNAAAGQVSIRHGLMGPSMSVSSACASGSNAIGEAFLAVRYGMVEAVVTGGTEAAITEVGVAGFMQMRALSTRNDEPERASRPFDKNRDGFVIAEGAGVLVLESVEHATRRGVEILAELVGYGASSDASHMTLPDPEGRGASRAMEAGLADARLAPEDISYINAHGTGTPAGDDIEAKAICRVFGDYAKKLPVSSSKSIFGHLLGASGALESAICIWALQDGIVPPTINLDEPDPECCGLDFVPHTSREMSLNAVMNNSFGFGGHNVCLIFKKFTG